MFSMQIVSDKSIPGHMIISMIILKFLHKLHSLHFLQQSPHSQLSSPIFSTSSSVRAISLNCKTDSTDDLSLLKYRESELGIKFYFSFPFFVFTQMSPSLHSIILQFMTISTTFKFVPQQKLMIVQSLKHCGLKYI